MPIFTVEELGQAHLLLNAIYTGGRQGNVGDDPISKLFKVGDNGVGNMGGFRLSGSPALPKFVVLYTSGEETAWPDVIDNDSGLFTYFGDNRSPGMGIHETPRGGNLILRNVFNSLHSGDRDCPPFFVFEKEGSWRDVIFRGLAVPGSPSVEQSQELVRYWDNSGEEAFQNYRAIFSILDTPFVHRRWLSELYSGNDLGLHCPIAWRRWREDGGGDSIESSHNGEGPSSDPMAAARRLLG